MRGFLYIFLAICLSIIPMEKASARTYGRHSGHHHSRYYNYNRCRGAWFFDYAKQRWRWKSCYNRYPAINGNVYAPAVPQASVPQTSQLSIVEQTPSGNSSYLYCQYPSGYYPYVKQCMSGWMKVAAVQSGSANDGYESSSEAEAANASYVDTENTPTNSGKASARVATSKEKQSDNDLRQFNIYLEEIQRIEADKSEDAPSKLDNLKHRVSIFRRSVASRKYNTKSLIKDIDSLNARISSRENDMFKNAAFHKAPNSLDLPVLTSR